MSCNERSYNKLIVLKTDLLEYIVHFETETSFSSYAETLYNKRTALTSVLFKFINRFKPQSMLFHTVENRRRNEYLSK